MAGRTRRFGFNKFGAGTPGTIGDDGQKYTSVDRDLLDRLLEQVELHTHHYRLPEGAPAGLLTATVDETGGLLRGGETYYYRFAVLDAQGMESLASGEIAVPTPDLLQPPGPVSVHIDDETPSALAPGNYYYAATGLRGAEETTLGAVALTSVMAGDGAVVVTLPPFGEADALRLWRMGHNDSGFTRLAIISVGQTEYVDDGSVPPDPCACDPGNTPPQGINAGISNYAITLTLPPAIDLATSTGWRLYRSTVSGIYPVNALVQEVVETADEWDPESPIIRSWTDTGARTVQGKPQDMDANMRVRPYSFDVADELPAPLGYPEAYPLLVGRKLYAIVDGAWELVAGGSGGGSTGPVTLTSPSGFVFRLVVDDAGVLSTVPTNFPGAPAAPIPGGP